MATTGIRERGYRHWEGRYSSHAFRWWTVAKQGLRSTIYSKPRLVALILFMFLVWTWYIFQGLFWFFFAELEFREALFGAPDTYLRQQLYEALKWWAYLVVPVFVATVGSPLVSNDLRSNALYIYLAKPMRRIDYILGKVVAILLWTIPVTLLPNLFVWSSAMLSGSRNAKLQEPTEILFEILIVQFVFLTVLALLVLAISSLTKRWQGALMSFLGGYFVLIIVTQIIVETTRDREWAFLSIAGNVVNFAQEILEAPATDPEWAGSLWILAGLAAGAFGVFLWRMLRLEVAE